MIYDEVALGLRARGMKESDIKIRVENVLKICGLYAFELANCSFKLWSKKRVTIASVLVLNPEIIILDEPTAGQDFYHYNEIMSFLIELNRQGKTIIRLRMICIYCLSIVQEQLYYQKVKSLLIPRQYWF